ncbi:MAG: hypothetical protein SGI92_31240 [Bryobacteraceae bacterium]|nr:hypothetical protein [Bryobacteraceae bacterium]
MPSRLLLFPALLTAAAFAQDFRGKPAVTIANDKIEITVLRQGAALASIVLRDDPSKLNPLWTPEQRPNGGFGHFICVDGFGGMSPEESKAGLQGHGEALRTEFQVIGPITQDGVSTVTLTALLPLVQERFTRSYELRPGENVVYVRSRLESLVAFDRTIAWAEHATIGSPFLERAVTAVDQSGTQSRSRPYNAAQKGRRSLDSGKDFTWPAAPLASGSTVDLRTAPISGATMDHSTTRQDTAQPNSWVTAVNPKMGRLIGWVWRTSDFPWLQNWQNYPEQGVLARGLEFSTQPWDVPRREAVALNPMMGNPTFRWLPAKAAIETTFVLFYTPVPRTLTRVTSLDAGSGKILLNGTLSVPAAGQQ